MILRALWLAVLFSLMGVRLAFDLRYGHRVYLHIGKHRVTEPVSVVVLPRGAYEVVSMEDIKTHDRHDTFMTAFIELGKFA